MAAVSPTLGAARTERPAGDASASSAIVAFRLPPYALALLVGGVVVLCAPFWRALEWLWVVWMQRPEYSHGPLMPLIAAFLAWQQKDRLERVEFTGSWWGPVLLVLAGLGVLLGKLGSVATIQQYALVLAFGALVLSLTGASAFRRLLAAMIVLLLMIPQPPFVLNNLSAELQLLSSQIGVAFIRAMGITVFAEGNVIDLGVYRLQVVEACDGLRYLFPLMAIGLLIAYFYKGAMWKRVLVFLASIPITILMNSLRVGTIGVMVEHWGVRMAEGFLHEFQGWMVFMLSAGLLIALTAALNRVGRETGTWRQLFGLEFPAPTPAGATRVPRPVPAPFLASLAIVAGIGASPLVVDERGEIVPPRESFQAFPSQLGDWSGRRDTIDGEVLDVLQLDDYLMMNYARPGSGIVNLYVSWYDSQRDRRTAHSPRSCLPGGGWQILDIRQATIGDTGQRANRMVITDGESRQLVYYWFAQRGRTVTNELAVKWYLFLDALALRRTDGAMVRVMTPVAKNETVEEAERRLVDLARVALPRLPAYVPGRELERAPGARP
jgi:exosortase D (VPLPA-CTERM-specific)